MLLPSLAVCYVLVDVYYLLLLRMGLTSKNVFDSCLKYNKENLRFPDFLPNQLWNTPFF